MIIVDMIIVAERVNVMIRISLFDHGVISSLTVKLSDIEIYWTVSTSVLGVMGWNVAGKFSSFFALTTAKH